MNRLSIGVLAFSLALPVISRADLIYNVSLNTSSLIGNGSAPFALDFQLTSGDTASGVVNTVTLSDFAFGIGGSAASGGPFSDSGNATGGFSSTVNLNTSGGSFFNEFSQFFNPGNALTFRLELTKNPQPGGTPDEFTFQLIDKTNGEVSTTDPSGSDSLLMSISPVRHCSPKSTPRMGTVW